MLKKNPAEPLTREESKVLAMRCIDYITQAMSDYTPAFQEVFANRDIMKYEQPLREETLKTSEKNEEDEERNAWKSRVVVPYAKNALKGLLTHLLPFILDVDPFFGFKPCNRTSKLYRHAKENYQQEQLDHFETPWQRTVQTATQAALTDMTSILKVDWEQRYGIQTRWQLLDDGTQPVPAEETLLEYDGPKLTLIPFEQVVTFPRAGWDLQRSPGVAINFSLTGEEIVSRCAMPIEDGGYWPDAADTMRSITPDSDTTKHQVPTEGQTKEIGNETHDVQTGNSNTSFESGKYDLTEIYWRGEIETEVEGIGKVTAGRGLFLVVHQPSQTVLFCGKNPWWKGQRPYAYIQGWLDRDGLGGDAIRTTGAGHIQEGLTDLARVADDTLQKGLNPPILTSRSVGLDMEDYRVGNHPGGEIPMSEAFWQNGGDKLKPIFTAELNPNNIQALSEWYLAIGQKCTGDSEAMEQSPTGTEITATQAEQIVEGSQAGLLFIARNLMYGFRQVGELLDALNYQFLFNDGPQKLWQNVNGELTLPAPKMPPQPQQNAMPGMMPTMGQPSSIPGQLPMPSPGSALPGEEGSAAPMMPPMAPPPPPLTMWDTYTQASFVVTCNGVDSANKQIRHLRAVELMQIAMQDPTIWMNPDWRYAILYHVFETLDGQKDTAQFMGEHDEYLKKDDEFKQESQAHEDKLHQFAIQIEQIKHQQQQGEAETITPMQIFKEALAEYVAKAMAPAVAAREIAMPQDDLQVMKDMQEIIGTDLQHQQTLRALQQPTQQQGGNV